MSPEAEISPSGLFEVAKSENITLAEMPNDYQNLFIPVDIKIDPKRTRCVDERLLTREFKKYDRTPQIPGNDWSLVDTIRIITHIEEHEAFDLVERTLSGMGFNPTMHKHCGYLNLSLQNPSPLGIPARNQEVRKSLFAEANAGKVEHYLGEHVKGAKALINKEEDTTFNTREASSLGKPAFNFDYWFARKFAEAIQEKTLKSGEEFANEVARLYFRTIKALTRQEQVTIYYR